MARPIRLQRQGGWYHVAARGNDRRDIFRDDRDRRHFLELLAEMVSRFKVLLHCYVLMDNHYHLLIQLQEANLSRAIQWLNVSYTVWFNRRHRCCGHLLQGRFKSILVDEFGWGLAVSRYLHLNPVRVSRMGLGKKDQQQLRTGLTRSPDPEEVRKRVAALRRFQWSSYRAYIGLSRQPPWLEIKPVLRLGGGKQAEWVRNYRVHVENAVREGLDRSPWEEVRDQVVLGSETFIRALLAPAGDGADHERVRRLNENRPDLSTVIQCVERVKNEKWEDFRDRHGDPGRDLVLRFGRRTCGLTLAQLARALSLRDYATVGVALRRFEKKLSGGGLLTKDCREVERLLNVQTRP